MVFSQPAAEFICQLQVSEHMDYFFFNSQPTFLGQEDKVCSVSAEVEGPEEPLEGLDGRTAAEDRVWGDGLDLAFQGCHLPFQGVPFATSSLFGAHKWAELLKRSKI